MPPGTVTHFWDIVRYDKKTTQLSQLNMLSLLHKTLCETRCRRWKKGFLTENRTKKKIPAREVGENFPLSSLTETKMCFSIKLQYHMDTGSSSNILKDGFYCF